ncbi:hypothetical protein [Streptosporangium sp. 'caverna']|uniref:hypothetical protein n=1 Tax=Streptosporangium sp. 'caverna' TaxID=2202249 RepID=UPI001EF93B60|nr:hypothetical protein [Streptosporangium sp. 'caverna']
MQGDDPHPAGSASDQGVVQPVQPCRRPLLQVGDKCRGIDRLGQGGVVNVAVVLKVTGQVLVRIPPLASALDVNLPPTQRLPQGDQHTQFVRDVLDPHGLSISDGFD